MYRQLWFLSFPRIWYETYLLKRRRAHGAWTDVQYYQAMYSLALLRPEIEGDKFAALRASMTGALRQDRASARILDLATGCGYQARDLWRQGYQHVYACDLVDSRISLARAHNTDTGIRFLLTDMRHMTFPTAFFDAITVSAALHDLGAGEVEAGLRECGRVLRPGGQLLLLEPRSIWDWPPLLRKFYSFVAENLDESLSMQAYVDLDMVRLAEQQGFELQSKRAFWLGGLCLYAFVKRG